MLLTIETRINNIKHVNYSILRFSLIFMGLTLILKCPLISNICSQWPVKRIRMNLVGNGRMNLGVVILDESG